MSPVPRSYPVAVAANHVALCDFCYQRLKAPAAGHLSYCKQFHGSGTMVKIHNNRRISTFTVHARLAFVGGHDLAHCEVICFLDLVVTWTAPVVILLIFLCCLFSPFLRSRREIGSTFLLTARADHPAFPTLKPRV